MNTSIFFVVLVLFNLSYAQSQLPPEVNYNVTQLITSRGYPCEDHYVTTTDGYVLEVQRIPSSGPPVYLQHGFLDSAATWVMNAPNEALGFMLSDAGFDVWLGNTRGNTYCQSNIYFDNSTQEFWNFSFDEIAKYDIPAKIDYILSQTNTQTLSYIGHSEGTLVGFIEFSSNNVTASKVNLFVALAPIVYLTNAGDLIKLAADLTPTEIEDIYGTMGFMEHWSEDAKLIYDVCSKDDFVCQTSVCAVAGCEIGNLNDTMLPVYFNHFPAGSSIQNLLHYQQYVKNGLFQKFDYGSSSLNEKHYGSSTPPMYSLSTLYTPTALFSGSHDKFADPTDVAKIPQEMPIPPYYQDEIPRYGHADFVWGMDAHRKLYPNIITLLQQVN